MTEDVSIITKVICQKFVLVKCVKFEYQGQCKRSGCKSRDLMVSPDDSSSA